MKNHLLSFELTKDKDELLIHGDEDGLKLLIQVLERLIGTADEGHLSHDHLMTPTWGGRELSEENKGGTVVNHVKVYCYKGNATQNQ